MENRTGRIDRKDVFRAGLVEHARFEGAWEMPVIPSPEQLPDRLVPFDKALCRDHFGCFVHFYMDDERFERIWNRPGDYLTRLKRFRGGDYTRLQPLPRPAAGTVGMEHVSGPCDRALAGAKRDRGDSQCPLGRRAKLRLLL